jgi:DNA-binding XRE family transcriptional regulator
MIMLHKNLRYLREKTDYKLEWIAYKVGVSHSTISNYESLKSQPKLITLILLAELFKVTVDDLLTKDLSKPNL